MSDNGSYLDDQQVMRRDILPRLDFPTSFSHIYGRVFHANNDAGCQWTEEKEPFKESGLRLGNFPVITDLPQFLASQQAYVLDSGKIAKVTTKKENYDTGKSVSCYGEYGTVDENSVDVLDGISEPIKHRLEGLIGEKMAINEMIKKSINDKRIEFGPYQWEGGCNDIYDDIRSVEGLKKRIAAGSVNEKIFINHNIIPIVAKILSVDEKIQLAEILKMQTKDPSMCEIGWSTSYADNEDTSTVSSSANGALSELA